VPALDPFSARKQFIQVGRAKAAYYKEGQGEPVLFIPGFPSSYIWRKVIPLVSPAFHCLTLDLMGLGDTAVPLDEDFILPAQARMVKGFLDALRISQAHIVGHDTGGAVAQIFAAKNPESVLKLILCNCDAYDNWPPPQVRRLMVFSRIPGALFLFAKLMQNKRFAGSSQGLGRCVYDKRVLADTVLEAYVRPSASTQERRKRLKKYLLGFDNRYTMEVVEDLKKLEKPTMVVWACEDRYFSTSWAQKLYDEIPGAERLELLPFAGLFFQEEKPEEFAKLVLDFLMPTAA